MKKILLPLFAILIAAAWLIQPKKASAAGEKVTICHREGNGSSHEITVSINAVPAHMAHGDAIGTCGVANE